MRIAPVPANHLYVSASGTVSQLQEAFHTTLMSYQADGVYAVAPAAAVRVPAEVAVDVAGVTGLDTRITATACTGPAYRAAAGPVTCSAYVFQNQAALPPAHGRTTFPTQGCGYTPRQFTQVLPPSFNFGPSGGSPLLQAVNEESVGDLESVHEMAPGAGWCTWRRPTACRKTS